MPKVATGEVLNTREGLAARVTLHGKVRTKCLLMPWTTDRDEAGERSKLLATVAKRLIAAKIADSEAEWMLEQIAARPPKSLRAAIVVAEDLIGAKLPDGGEAVPTFAAIGKQWTNGELHA